jgi:hypothetical protein
MSTYILSIVEIMVVQTTINSLFRGSSVTYTTQNGVYIYTGNGHRRMLAHPCGIKFDLRGLKISKSSVIYYGYLDNSRTKLFHCICPNDVYNFKQCQSVRQSTLRNKISKAKEKLALKIDKLQKLSLFEGYKSE